MGMTTRKSSIPLAVIAVACAMAITYFLRSVLIPLVLAFVLAVLVNALVRFIGTWCPRAPRWLVLILAALVVTVAATAGFIILAQGATNIVTEAPFLSSRIDWLLREAGRAMRLRKALDLATLVGGISVPSIAATMATGVGDLFSGLLLMITYFGFILAGRERVNRKLEGLFALAGRRMPIEEAVEDMSRRIEKYMWVHTVTGSVVAGASALVMFAVGLHNALFWTVMLFMLCYIPMIGVTVGSIAPALFALVQFAGWWQSALIFGGIQLAAMVVGNFVYPRLQAQAQNIDPLVTLFALAFWGYLWGIAGAFLAVPMTVMVMIIATHFPASRWLAVILSNDGKPFSRERLPRGCKDSGPDQTRIAKWPAISAISPMKYRV